LSLNTTALTGHRLDVLMAPAGLKGANGIRFGPDGRLWICEAFAQRITALEIASGDLTTIIPTTGPLMSPDDLAFDATGNLYITDGTRISVRRPDGTVEVLTEGLTGANGITVDHRRGRLFVNEYRAAPDGRLMEIDQLSGEVRIILDGIGHPNACDMGEDGRIYFQSVSAGVVFAVDPDTCEVEKIAEDLVGVSAVKFDHRGRLVAALSQQGHAVAIDLRTGERTVQGVMPLGGVDNLDFGPRGQLYLSSYSTGQILEVVHGRPDRVVVPPGLMDLTSVAVMPGGRILAASGLSLMEVSFDGALDVWCKWLMGAHSRAGMAQTAVPVDDESVYLLTRGGRVHLETRSRESIGLSTPVAEGIMALGSSPDGPVVAINGGDLHLITADGLGARLASTGMDAISAVAGSARWIVAASADSGRLAVVRGDEVRIAGGYARPTGVAVHGDHVYVADHQRRVVVRHDLSTDERLTVAEGLPFGPATPEAPTMGTGSLAVLEDGSVLIGCDGDGSIRRLTPG
jgi:sugar lactone lactonase YvrE